MSKKEKIDLKNKIDAIVFGMELISDRIDKEKGFVSHLRETDDTALKISFMYIDKLNEHLNVLEDIRAEYQKRLSQ